MSDSTIPILDLGPYLHGETGALDATAGKLRHINETIGFLFIVNPNFPTSRENIIIEQGNRGPVVV